MLTVVSVAPFDDWVVSPNIVGDPETYEMENEAIRRDGRLDMALARFAPWSARTLLDIGCGTGFWLPEYARTADRVIGVEPDPTLRSMALDRTSPVDRIEVLGGSAEHLPVDDDSVDVVHARFAYFFGDGAGAGLDEVRRVLRSGGVFVAIDNDWSGGDFARLLRASTGGNADIDPRETQRWWAERGADRHVVEGGWIAESVGQLEQILRIEFPREIVDDFMAGHDRADLSYRFAVFVWRPGAT